jgi:hypothetical protein
MILPRFCWIGIDYSIFFKLAGIAVPKKKQNL